MRSLPGVHRRSSRRSDAARHLLHLLVLATHMAVFASGCKLDLCSSIFNDVIEPQHGESQSANYCLALREYERCMNKLGDECKANLSYRAYKSMVSPLKIRHNCSHHNHNHNHNHHNHDANRGSRAPTTTPTPAPPTPPSKCVYKGRKNLRHCALFGDPHLKTFGGSLETCRVRGAWPLIENKYLAVQVTNEQVLPGSNATATTKVTVIVKNASTECTTEKILEARGGEPLPDTFNDGTTEAGPDRAISLTKDVDRHGPRIEVQIRYIESTVVIRQVGRYLTFSARMPEEVVTPTEETMDVQQLCVQGCFSSERMDPAKSRGTVLSREEAEAGCLGRQSNQVELSLAPPYLDWCVFDLMTTGDYDFVKAAKSAHHDTRWLDPKSLEDRGSGSGSGSDSGSGSGSVPQARDDRLPGYSSALGSAASHNAARGSWLLIFFTLIPFFV